ncbi:MAG: hypothetical protein GC150_03505 [Rhizobiales bacterium]|nr:hypothetical protein [Hyphomicrobiales bacterium]
MIEQSVQLGLRTRIALAVAVFVVSLATVAGALATLDGKPSRILFQPVPADVPAPVITAASAEREVDGSWTLRLDVTNFGFLAICRPAEEGRVVGHAHVYSRGRKIATAFAPIISLGRLAQGRHRLLVTLQATDHRAFVTNDGMITAEIEVDVPA